MDQTAGIIEGDPSRFSSGKNVFKIAFIALCYYGAHRLAFLFPDSAKVIMAIWPAGGIGLAVLLLNPRRLWPAIAATLFISGLAADLLQSRGFLRSTGFMTANVLESLGSAWLISWACGVGVRFTRVKEVLILIIAAICVNACTSFLGAGCARITSSASFWGFWKTWWIADGLGILLITPFITAWAVSPRSFFANVRWLRGSELGIFMVLWCGFVWMFFHSDGAFFSFQLRPYMLFPLIVWLGMRFDQRIVTLAILTLAALTVSGASLKGGPFPWAIDDPMGRLLTAQTFLGIIAGTGMLFAAGFMEMRSTRKVISESEAHFSQLFHLSPVGVALSRVSDEKFVDVNDAFSQICGYTREEILGHTSKELGLWPIREDREQIVSKITRDGQVKQAEARFRRKSGETGDLLISMGQVDINGQKHLLGVVSDITERKQTENAIRASEIRYRSLFNNSRNGLAYCQMLFEDGKPQDFIYLEVNDVFTVQTGFKDVIGKKVSEIIPGICEKDPELLERYGRVAQGGPSEKFEMHVNALKQWFTISAYCPQKGYFVAVFDNITERKKMEESLRQANESLAIAQRASGTGAWDWDLVTGKTIWSSEFFGLLGLDASREPSVEVWSSVLHPEDRQLALDRLNASLREHRSLSSEYRIVLPSGEVRWIHALGDMDYDDRGEPRRMSGFCIDITVRKKSEEMLVKLMEAKSKFTATVSHELRSPLATIKAATDLVLDGLAGAVSSEQKDLLGTAKESIDRLGRLINNVLVYQKIEAGKMGYNIREQDINEVVREVRKSMELSAGARNEDIVMELQGDLPSIKIDKDKIFQVLTNLMANALKYSESGQILFRTQRENNEIHVTVRDFGLGIKADNLQEVFEPFSQVENHPHSGTGLGLAISKEIVLSHHGRIWAESEMGKGSTFHVTLPL